MPSEIEKISHQPPYVIPAPLRRIDAMLGAGNTDIPRELVREVGLLRDQIVAYQLQLHRDSVEAFSELSACVNTLFDRFNRLPILPEITTPTTNTVAFTNEGSGVVSIDIGQQWLMRGNIVVDTDDFTTTQRQFTTASSKTYHVRWDATNGLRYIDTTDATYNPGALAENDAAFFSTETDILLQKIVTNGSNVPTFTAVLNLAHDPSLLEHRVAMTPTASAQQAVSGLIVAGARIAGVTVKIVSSLGTASGLTGFDVGDSSIVDHWGNNIGITAGTMTSQSNFQSADIPIYNSDTDVLLTAYGGNFESVGLIELKSKYWMVTHA